MEALKQTAVVFAFVMVLGTNAHAAIIRNACPAKSAKPVQTGFATWYDPNLQGQKTSSGEPYDTAQLTAAHPSLPMNTKVKVTNRVNGRSVVLRINDRGPFVANRLIDVSQAGADAIGMKGGTAPVSIRVMCPGEEEGSGRTILLVPPKKPKDG